MPLLFFFFFLLWPEQMSAIEKVVVWSAIEEPIGEHLGAVGQAEGRVEYIVTLMRLSDSS